MIVWILMVLDLIVLSIVSIAHFSSVYYTMILFYCAGYLIIKFAIFREIMSGIDAVFGVYIIVLAIFHVSSFLYFLMLGWFAYKFLFTLVS